MVVYAKHQYASSVILTFQSSLLIPSTFHFFPFLLEISTAWRRIEMNGKSRKTSGGYTP